LSVEPSYLVADIGGTNARFAIARGSAATGFTLHNLDKHKASDFADLGEAARAYLAACGCAEGVRLGCFGVAGPVGPGVVALTNSPWRLDPEALAKALGLERIVVVNDFAALARGAPMTTPGELIGIKDGTPVAGAPFAVLGPGTGLGVGLVVPTRLGLRVVPTEGGHAAFAPRNDLERMVAEHVARTHGYVSWERVISGMGLPEIDAALAAADGRTSRSRTPGEITKAALSGSDPHARAAVELFCTALGGFASDVAVIAGARGGVYLGGGILPRIVELLRASGFVARFTDKGPMSPYVEAIPVKLIVSDKAALLGAAALAEEAAG
jgi:glucokinase